jgi:lipoprotein signal peptidase
MFMRIMPNKSYRWLLYGLALAALVVDQASKYGVFGWLGEKTNPTFVVFRAGEQKGGFQLVAQYTIADNGERVPHVNHGALFGVLREHKTLANAGFALISFLAAAIIIFWSRQRSTASDRWLCTALGLILGGTLGNFYDRVVFNGVRDFLHWNYLFDWPVFNFADCCLVAGAALLLVQAFLVQPSAQPAPSETATAKPSSTTSVSLSS